MALAAHLRAPLTRRLQANLAGLGNNAAPKITAAFAGLDHHDEAELIRFARKADPIVAAAKTNAIRLGAGYYALLAGVRPVPVLTAEVPIVADLRDPFVSTWRALAAGHDYPQAVAAGAARAEAVIRNVITSSSRQTGDVVARKTGLEVAGWERIPDPDACPWCLEVADAVYSSAEAADFGHDRCGCTAAPLLV